MPRLTVAQLKQELDELRYSTKTNKGHTDLDIDSLTKQIRRLESEITTLRNRYTAQSVAVDLLKEHLRTQLAWSEASSAATKVAADTVKDLAEIAMTLKSGGTLTDEQTGFILGFEENRERHQH